MDTRKKIYLIDGSAYIYRSFHALPMLTNSKGIPTNAILGFTNILTKLIKDKEPQYLAMFFDAKGPTFRHKIYSEYKANRAAMPDDLISQIPFIKKITKGFNLPSVEEPGFEADDLIGTVALGAEKAGFNVVLVTSDKDFMQLVSEHIVMFDPVKDLIIDREAVKEKTGVYPERIVDIMALTGDSSDNVPGVPGIGKKTAPVLIQTYGGLDELYKNIDLITAKKQKENLINFKEQAYLSKQLVTIDTNAHVDILPEECKFKEPDSSCLFDLFSELEFRKHMQIFPKKTDLSEKKYSVISDRESLATLISELRKSTLFAVDTETTSTNPMLAKLVGLSFSMKENEAFYIPCSHDYPDAPKQLDLEETLESLRPVLEDPAIEKVGQNIKYDLIVLKRHGINLTGIIFDTMIASYLLNPAKRTHGLDQIALELFNHKTISYEDVAGKGKKALCFSQVPLESAIPYACEDADITLAAFNVFRNELEKEELCYLFEQVEMPLIDILADIEMNGISIDKDKLRELSKTFEIELTTIEKDIYSLAGEEFNIKSSQQLGHILFDKLQLPVQKKTKKKTGYSTDVDVLSALSSMHELPALILRYRTIAKLKSTYTDALLEIVHPETNRIHTSFNQTITVTGRLSSSEPNLQNIPIRTEEGRLIRSSFIPKEGWSLLSADYSQIELRLLAHCSDDAILIDAFVNNEDIHTRTASEVFDHHPSFITKELRRQAKAINFGIVYGMSAFGLSKELNISQKMAKTYIDNYFTRYSGVKDFIDKTIQDAKTTGKTSTLLGRTRKLPEINSSNHSIRQFAERAAINTPIQGTAADLIKMAMIQTKKAIESEKLNANMLLSVHDEIVFEIAPDDVDAVSQIVKQVMENIWELKVPLKVNIESGKNWAEAH